jgi:predicted RNA-binding Zn ribbon-like protein
MAEPMRTLAGLDMVGGNPALDLANTINSRRVPEHDYLSTSDDLRAWAERAGLPPRAPVLGTVEDARQVRSAHRLREAIYRTFSAIAAGSPPPATDVRRVLRAYGAAVSRASLDPSGQLEWPSPSTPLDPVAFAAGQLLLAPDRPPVKECPGCGWLFLDRSRNGSRRWCDMQTCGSRDKMRRYYRSRRGA